MTEIINTVVMAEDEEVVFENSSLYHHLQEAGFSDEDISPETLSSAVTLAEHELLKQSAQKEREEEEQRKRQRVKVTVWGLLVGTCKWLLGYPAYQHEIRNKHQMFTSDLVVDILDSEQLEEEDYDHVDNMFTTLRERAIGSAESVGEFVKHMILAVIVLGYGFGRALQIKRTGEANMQHWCMDVLTVTLLSIALTPALVKVLLIEFCDYKMKRRRTEMAQLLDRMRVLRKTFHKSIRLIQEKELVFRGFTMVNAQTPIERLEQSALQRASERQCPQLRKQLYHTARTLMLHYKRATAAFLAQYPSGSEDGSSSYLAHIPLEEYGPCVCVTDDKELAQATDQYSITALKAIANLSQVHLSELVRVMVLALLSRAYVYKQTDFYAIVDSLLSHEKPISQQLGDLNTSLVMHRSGRSSSDEVKKPRLSDDSQSPTYTAVHSLKLHLQAALNKVESAEQDVESGDKDSAAMLKDLQHTKTELDACVDCLEEAIARATNTPRSTGAEADGLKHSGDEVKEDDIPHEPPVALFDPEAEPTIQDQVFEAYVEPEMDSSEWDSAPLLSQEEKEKKKQEKKEALRMLKELKTVMGVRAQEREERERIALQRMKGEEQQEEEMSKVTDDHSKDSNPSVDQLAQGLRKRNVAANENTSNSSASQPVMFCTKCNASNTTITCSCTSSASILDTDTATATFTDRDAAWDDLSNKPYKPPQPRIEVGDEDESVDHRRERLGKVMRQGIGGAFQMNIAAVAAAKGQQRQGVGEDTFGDSSDDDLIED